MMKLVILFLTPLAALALANVVPNKQQQINVVGQNDAFDPTAGENAPLTYNNKNEVWVPQV